MEKTFAKELLRLTILQKEALEKEDVEAFNSLMEKKQRCIDEIDGLIHHRPENLKEEDKALLTEAAKIDAENQREFNRQFEEVKEQLRKIRALKKRDHFYANPYDVSREEGIFFDKKQGKP